MSEHRELRITRRDGSEHVVIYDVADAPIIESRHWYVSESNSVPGLFYARCGWVRNGKRGHMSMHVLIMGRTYIDHINSNGLDNRRSNLRPATKSQNSANQRPRRGGTSQYKGVYWVTQHRRWMAKIRVDGRPRYIGIYADEVQAAKAYDAAALEAFGEFAYLNFPLVSHD